MPRFFFHIQDGVSLPDLHGAELANIEAVQREAIRRSGAMIADNAMQMKLGEDWHMEVTDEAGLILFRLEFYVSKTAATQGNSPGDGAAAKL